MALSAMDWYSLGDKLVGCFSLDVGRGLLTTSRVGKASSAIDMEGDERDAGVSNLTRLARLVYLRFSRGGSVEGSSVEALRAVGVAAGWTGDDALLFALESPRSRAGNTLFGGTASAIAPLENSARCWRKAPRLREI
jgi:hypothetical protein